MAVLLSPVGGVAAQFFTDAGVPLSGGKIYTYVSGTTIPLATYTTSVGNISHSNPIVLDAAGRVPTGEIWLANDDSYKFVLKDYNDVLIATYDNIVGINSNFVPYTEEQEIQVATAGQTVFTLADIQYLPGTNNLAVYVDGVNQYGPNAQYAYTETSPTSITFTAGLHKDALVKFSTAVVVSTNVVRAAGSDGQIQYNVSGELTGFSYGTSGYVLTSQGNGLAPTWSAASTGTVTAVTATSPVASSGGTTPNISISQAGVSSNGYLSSTDWNTFNNKGSGTVTSVTGTSPIASSGGATPAISISQATTSTNGYLSSTDWNTFNNKQAALVSGTNIKTINGSSVLGSGNLTVTATAAGSQGQLQYNDTGALGAVSSGVTGQVLTSQGTGVAPTWTNVSGTGDVVGPASATDNAIVRFDSTTGKLIQNSTVTIDDAGNIIDPDSIQFSGTVPATQPIGTLWFDSTTDTLNFQQNAITQQIGEEIYVYGKASATISGQTILQAIYKTGVVGASGNITFAPTIAGITDGGSIIGVATEDITSGDFGRITNFGIVHGINTTGSTYGETWVDGQDIWYNPVTGGLTKTKPVAPNIKFQIGTVINAGSGGSGSFQVLLQPGSTLGGTDSNVEFGTLTSGNTLIYDAVAGYWKNANLTAGTGVSVTNGAGSITIANTGVTSVTGTAPIASSGGTTPAISISQAGASTDGYLSSTDWNNFNNKGSGTVTSVTGTSPVTSSGGATPAIGLASGYGDTQNPYASKTANYFLAAPNGSSGAPTFRALVAADVPTLNQNTTGSAGSVANALTAGTGISFSSGTTYNGSAAITINNSGVTAYPSAGLAVSTGSAWGTSKTSPTGDVVGTTDSQTLSAKTVTGLKETKVALGANEIDVSTGNWFTKTITTTTTFTVSNVPVTGTAASFILDLTNGGSSTITWWSGVTWAGGTAPTLTAAGRDSLGFYTYDGGTTWTGLVLGKDIK